jgi:uncharacterized protein YodC (DUF2158 family)
MLYNFQPAIDSQRWDRKMSNMATFAPGDVVQLKSGGPPMTVNRKHASSDELICNWFDGKKHIERTFNAALLARYVPPRRGAISFVF